MFDMMVLDRFRRVAMLKENQLKPTYFGLDKKTRVAPLALVVAALCLISFYLGGALKSEEGRVLVETFDGAEGSLKAGCAPVVKQGPFQECNLTLTDYTPCTDPVVMTVTNLD